MAAQKQDDKLERTFSSYVRIEDVVLKTYLGRWTIGRSGERGSGISVLPARYDDDDIYMNESTSEFAFRSYILLQNVFLTFGVAKMKYIYIYIYIYIYNGQPKSRATQKSPFLIATTLRWKGGRYSFPWVVPITLYLCLKLLGVMKLYRLLYCRWRWQAFSFDTFTYAYRPDNANSMPFNHNRTGKL